MEKKRSARVKVLEFLFINIFSSMLLTNIALCQDVQNTKIIKLKYGIIKISLPTEYEKISSVKEKEDTLEISVPFKRENPKAGFDILISDLGNNPFYNTESYQMKFLDETKFAIKKECEGSSEKVSDEYTKLFGAPALVMTYEKPDKITITREIFFIRNCKLYIITFLCEKEYFDNQWSVIEQSVKNIEFIQE